MTLRIAAAALIFCLLAGAQDSSKHKASGDQTGEQANPAAAEPEAPPLLSCPAGTPLGSLDMSVKSQQPGLDPLPFQNINHLSEGDTITYSPVLRGNEKRPGDIALVMVPVKKKPEEPALSVTEPKNADKPQEWQVDRTVALVGVVYGPAGLSKKKVSKFLSQDNVLVAQLADYAEKTAQTEQLVAALSNSESSSDSVNAALNGFASQYGFAVQIDKGAPPATQAQTLFASMNPQLATYNPLASSTAERAGQTASLATTAAALFFGSPVGVAAGGTAMLLDLKSISFPDTQFRASFAETLKGSQVNLCGQKAPTPPHTRVAYIWAARIPNAPTPTIKIGKSDYLPEGQKSPLPVDVPEASWKYLSRAREWTISDDKNNKVKVPVLTLGNQKSLELDLAKAKLTPGDYHLSAFWDWTPFTADGVIHVQPLSTFDQARLEPASQDKLLAHSGKVQATLTGADFQFTTKVELKKLGDEFATSEPVKFLLPDGLRNGPQTHMDVQVDTAALDPGQYEFLVSQQDDKSHPIKFNVLDQTASVTNFPVLVNQGVSTQHFVLKGQRLQELAKLEASGAKFELGDVTNNGTERTIRVQLDASLKPGAPVPVEEYMKDRATPETISAGLQIIGPLPLIASTRLSLPTGMTIATRANEFPAGSTLTAMLDVKNMERRSALQLSCDGDTSPRATLQIGEKTNNFSLQQLSPDQLFLSYGTASLPAGCDLEAMINNGRNGKSQPYTLAKVVLMPQIDSFTAAGTTPDGATTYTLTGQNLEMIQKIGWSAVEGVDVASLPAPLPGQDQKQSLTVNMPPPAKMPSPPPNTSATLNMPATPNMPAPASNQPCVYLWLRGDDAGRATTLKLTASSSQTAAPPTSAHATPHVL